MVEPLAGFAEAGVAQRPGPELEPEGEFPGAGGGRGDQQREAVGGVIELGEADAERVVVAVLVGDQRLREELLFGVEPVEDRGRADADPLGDVGEPGPGDAALGDDLGGGRKYLRTPNVIDLWPRARAPSFPRLCFLNPDSD